MDPENPVFKNQDFLNMASETLLDLFIMTKGDSSSTTVNFKGHEYTVSIGEIAILDQIEARCIFTTARNKDEIKLAKQWTYHSVPKLEDGTTGWRPYAVNVIECNGERLRVSFS